jgi:putative chitinase
MAKITLETFKNFFKYYSEEAHQIRAIEELYADLQHDCCEHLDDESDWILTYRNKPQVADNPKPVGQWPITKQEMASIMGCAVSSLPDSLMDDFARCVDLYSMDRTSIAYFLGQCGHESAGLRYPVEIHNGSNYEGRTDLGNIYPGDGVLYAGTGWIQVTGRYNHQAFSDYMQKKGEFDANIMEKGKYHSSEKYPWSISGFWWYDNKMNEYCAGNPPVDRVGQRVNGRYLPNGYEDRRHYSRKAFDVLGLPYPGN